MEKVFKIETTLSGELAELYAGLTEAFAARGDMALGELNTTLLQTGLIHHLLMMRGMGLIEGAEGKRLDEFVEYLARETIMWEVVQWARQYWRDSAASGGTIDLKA